MLHRSCPEGFQLWPCKLHSSSFITAGLTLNLHSVKTACTVKNSYVWSVTWLPRRNNDNWRNFPSKPEWQLTACTYFFCYIRWLRLPGSAKLSRKIRLKVSRKEVWSVVQICPIHQSRWRWSQNKQANPELSRNCLIKIIHPAGSQNSIDWISHITVDFLHSSESVLPTEDRLSQINMFLHLLIKKLMNIYFIAKTWWIQIIYKIIS